MKGDLHQFAAVNMEWEVMCSALYDRNFRIVHLTNDLAFSNKQLETLQAGLL
jgi:hypothetical protein